MHQRVEAATDEATLESEVTSRWVELAPARAPFERESRAGLNRVVRPIAGREV
jgi:hypothetical protein